MAAATRTWTSPSSSIRERRHRGIFVLPGRFCKPKGSCKPPPRAHGGDESLKSRANIPRSSHNNVLALGYQCYNTRAQSIRRLLGRKGYSNRGSNNMHPRATYTNEDTDNIEFARGKIESNVLCSFVCSEGKANILGHPRLVRLYVGFLVAQ